MCDSHKNDKNKKGDEGMVKTATINYPNTNEARKPKILKALKEVDKIRAGRLPRESARDFLKESRNKK